LPKRADDFIHAGMNWTPGWLATFHFRGACVQLRMALPPAFGQSGISESGLDWININYRCRRWKNAGSSDDRDFALGGGGSRDDSEALRCLSERAGTTGVRNGRRRLTNTSPQPLIINKPKSRTYCKNGLRKKLL